MVTLPTKSAPRQPNSSNNESENEAAPELKHLFWLPEHLLLVIKD